MSTPQRESVRDLLISDLREAYMEIFPAPHIEQRLEVLEPNSYVAVTCSPTKGVAETLDLTERLVKLGFRVAPHVAARNVRNQKHLAEIMARLRALGIESMFVPGGDRPNPAGEFSSALQLLQSISDIPHDIKEIGVAAHPEGHPDVTAESLLEALEMKQKYAHYMVTQMCFDANVLGMWLLDMRARGIKLPVWIGLPGAIERNRLIKASFRIGVGDSLRFLRRKSKVMKELMKSSVYEPDELVHGLAKYQLLPGTNVAGYHLFCFNQVENTETWRSSAIEALS
jgi:methylenetetrahydrofolate reductase (NADPH)